MPPGSRTFTLGWLEAVASGLERRPARVVTFGLAWGRPFGTRTLADCCGSGKSASRKTARGQVYTVTFLKRTPGTANAVTASRFRASANVAYLTSRGRLMLWARRPARPWTRWTSTGPVARARSPWPGSF